MSLQRPSVAGSFAAVGVGSVLTLSRAGDAATIEISGTYNESIKLQRELGSPGSGIWEDVATPGPWTTANATVTADYTAQVNNERIRLTCYARTSGTARYVLTEGDAAVDTKFDRSGEVVYDETEQERTYRKSVDISERDVHGVEETEFLGVPTDIVKGMVSRRDKFIGFFEDFHGSINLTGTPYANYWQSKKGAGANTAVATRVDNVHGGQVSLKSSDSEGTGVAANGANLGLSAILMKPSEGELYFETLIALNDVSEAYLFAGFTDANANAALEAEVEATGSATFVANAGDAAGVILDKDSTFGYFLPVGANNGTDKNVAPKHQITPADSKMIRIGVRVSKTGTLHAWVNDVKVTPDAGLVGAVRSSVKLCPIITIGTRSDNQVIAYVDYFLTMQDRVQPGDSLPT